MFPVPLHYFYDNTWLDCPIKSEKKYDAFSALINCCLFLRDFIFESMANEIESESLQEKSKNNSEISFDNDALMDCIRQYRERL